VSGKSKQFLPRDAMQRRPIPSCGVRLCASPSVCHVRGFCRTNKHIFKIFSPSGSHTILVFPYQTSWHYSDGNPPPPLTGASKAGTMGRNRDSEPISGSIACCEREVQYTQPRRTMASWWHYSWDDDEVYGKKPQRYAEHNRAALNCTQW